MSDWLPNAHPTLQEPQQQSRQSGGELMHEDAMDLFPSQQQVRVPQLAIPFFGRISQNWRNIDLKSHLRCPTGFDAFA